MHALSITDINIYTRSGQVDRILSTNGSTITVNRRARALTDNTAASTYIYGEWSIVIEVTFDEAVEYTDGAIELSVGGVNSVATLFSGHDFGSSTVNDDKEYSKLYWSYTVQDENNAPIQFRTPGQLRGTAGQTILDADATPSVDFNTITIPPSVQVHWPIAINRPRLIALDAAMDKYPYRFVDASGRTIDSAPNFGGSRDIEMWLRCLSVYEFGDAFITACNDKGGQVDALTSYSNPTPREVAYFGEGDTLYIRVAFTKNVKVAPSLPAPTLRLSFSIEPRYATLKSGEGSGSSDTLTFQYTVESGDFCTGGIRIGWGPLSHNTAGVITDVHGSPVNLYTTNVGLLEFYAGTTPRLEYNAVDIRHEDYKAEKFNVNAVQPDVRITGVIGAGSDTHDGDILKLAVFRDRLKREVLQNASPVTVSEVQTGSFTVEIRFYEHRPDPDDYFTAYAVDQVGFEGSDIEITDTEGNVLLWDVSEPEIIGLDHRAVSAGRVYGKPLGIGDATHSPSFLVYKATITPSAFNGGEVQIRLPEGATQNIARAPNKPSNVLTVTVVDSLPPLVSEPPTFVEKEVYTLGDKIEVRVTFDEDGVRFVGDNPPYLTLRLEGQTRHATWQLGSETPGSPVVTFAYPVQASDSATTVSIDAKGITIPSGTFLVDDDGNRVDGTVGFPEATPATVLTQDTLIVTVVPIFETPEPKAAASDVPRSPVVFNELGNGSGDANDWLEFRSVTGDAVSLKDWELSVVQDGKKEDTSLIVFPYVSVPANGLLLITNSDPTAAGNVLAGGDNITTVDAEKKGSPHQYIVNTGLSLPDDGKFLLILRKEKGKLGTDAAFVDVAGGGGSDTDAFVRETTGLYDTHVWPLQVLESPGGNTEAALGSGKVWQRAKSDIVGYHKDAWAEAAFTGIGYDRKVSKSAAHAGTPGYPNGAVKTGTAAPKGSVTFSEIMFDSGGSTLPQWIELYNKSKTEALNLNRWKLAIQNVDSEDLVGRPIVTLTLQEKVIQPNQTLLIVAGPARASSTGQLPAERVYNLLALHEKNLRIKTARDTFLSAEGFYLKLTDKDGNLVDEVGNTDGDRRTKDDPAWALPVRLAEGPRSSLIRRYDKGVAADGTSRYGWALAANFKQFKAEGLHYGHAADIGTPGHRVGGALPVELSSFSVTRNEAGAVVVTWITESEVDNAGFNLRRSEKRDSGFTLLNATLIAGAGTTGERQEYTFTDTSAKPGVEYYYQIEEVAFDGKPQTLAVRMLQGPVSASNRMLTTFGEVKQQK